MFIWKSQPTAPLRIAATFSIAVAIIVPLAAQTPRLQWTRQYGTGAFDQGHAVGYGEFGVYVAGETAGTFEGQISAGGKDAFISLHDESGNLKWLRQFGTLGEDVATGVAGDGSGAYVVGYTAGALSSQAGGTDSFIRKYDPNGDEIWTRQFGAPTDDYAYAVASHISGVYVVGYIECCGGSLPGQPVLGGTAAYIRKYDGDGSELWTRMISTGEVEHALGVAVDDTGVYVTGTTTADLAGPRGQRDGYLRKYTHDGAPVWTRQFGTVLPNGDAAVDDVYAVAASSAGIFVSGATAQGSGPGSVFAGGLWDAFVVKFDANGIAQWYRQIGTDGDDFAYGIAVGAGHVLVVGGTGSNLVSGAFVGGEDAFLQIYDLDGNVLGTRQFGDGLNDSGTGVVAFPGGFFVAGTKSGNALDVETLGDNDSFVMKVIAPPFVPAGKVLNAASFAPDPAPLAPGSNAIVSGSYLNEGDQVLSSLTGPDGKLTTSLGGTEISVNDVPAPILYSTPSQVSFQIPFEIAGQTTAAITVTVGGQTSFPRSINIAPAAPGIFTQNQAGTGESYALHEDGVTLVTAQNPARRNEVVTIYATGLGVLNPALGTGVPATDNAATERVSIAFGTANAVIEFAGALEDSVGMNRIRAQIPAGAPVGVDVPVSVTAGGRQGNPVTIAIAQ
jgi:uncharacterized protein (TIGR03437 family)